MRTSRGSERRASLRAALYMGVPTAVVGLIRGCLIRAHGAGYHPSARAITPGELLLARLCPGVLRVCWDFKVRNNGFSAAVCLTTTGLPTADPQGRSQGPRQARSGRGSGPLGRLVQYVRQAGGAGGTGAAAGGCPSPVLDPHPGWCGDKTRGVCFFLFAEKHRTRRNGTRGRQLGRQAGANGRTVALEVLGLQPRWP
jgi:hypothetical protein